MTNLTYSFKQILSTLTHAPESEALEPHLADFACKIGAAGQTLVYCQSEHQWFLPVGAAVSLLAPYGIELRGQWHDGKRFIYAALKPSEPLPFAPTQVLEHVNVWEVAA